MTERSTEIKSWPRWLHGQIGRHQTVNETKQLDNIRRTLLRHLVRSLCVSADLSHFHRILRQSWSEISMNTPKESQSLRERVLTTWQWRGRLNHGQTQSEPSESLTQALHRTKTTHG